MKKKIFIVLSIVLVLAVGILVVVLCQKKEPAGSEDISKLPTEIQSFEDKVLSVSNYDEFNALVESEELEVYYYQNNEGAEVVEFAFWTFPSDMSVSFDKEKNVNEISIYSQVCDITEYKPEMNNRTLEDEVYDECREIISNFAGIFGVDYTQGLRLTGYNGEFFDVAEASDMYSFLNCEAYIHFAVRDEVGCYYVMHISLFETTIEVEIVKHCDVETYLDYIANITLYEENE